LLKEVQVAGDLKEVVLAVAVPVEVVLASEAAAGGLAKCSCDP
jgi:hypothetical protein